MTACTQRVGVEVRLAAQLSNTFRNTVGMGHFLVGVYQEFVSNGWRGNSLGREIMPSVPQHAYPLRGQSVVQQATDFFCMRLDAGSDCAIFQRTAGLSNRVLIECHVRVTRSLSHVVFLFVEPSGVNVS